MTDRLPAPERIKILEARINHLKKVALDMDIEDRVAEIHAAEKALKRARAEVK